MTNDDELFSVVHAIIVEIHDDGTVTIDPHLIRGEN